MRSPKDMQIIQIDITNACVHRCSNCTRFCGHHRESFFMTFSQFKDAVDSLEDFHGIVGIIGGEPTLHPEFEKFVDYLQEKRVKRRVSVIRKPIFDMQKYIQNTFNIDFRGKKVGLWCSLNLGYYKHFEVINDTFEEQLLNDHDSECAHQALLMPRKDLGIGDAEWKKKRDSCWVQNKWSATVTPKGAFFCEVAGALDMLFHGKGGWKVEPGWWKREPIDFGEQLEWCELCSACLDVPQRVSNDERDDVTPQMVERLKAIGSPKIAQNMYVVHSPESYNSTQYHTFATGRDYIDAADDKRTSKKNRNLYPKNFVCASWETLNQILSKDTPTDWVLVSTSKEKAERDVHRFTDVILNPGCVYIYEDSALFNVKGRSIREEIKAGLSNPILSYYPLDKIVPVDLNEMEREGKMEALLSRMTAGNRVVVYGAGKIGKALFARLMTYSTYKVCGWVDQNFADIGYPVQSPDILDSVDFDYVLVAIQSPEIREEVKDFLLKKGIADKKILSGCPEDAAPVLR